MQKEKSNPTESQRLYEDLMDGFQELEEYARGERKLRVTTLSHDEPSPSAAQSLPSLSKEETDRANRHLLTFAGIAHSGDSNFGNNEHIDADLCS